MGAGAAAAGVYKRKFRPLVLVTAFHRVNDAIAEDGLTCSSAKFDAFCRFFKRYFNVVPLSEQVKGLREGRDVGGSISITFDDGYLDNYEVAAPILRRHGLPATFFITTGFIGGTSVPFWDRQLPRRQPWMNWDHVRALSRQGFDIGCHTVSHLNMGTSSPESVRAELDTSKLVLATELGRAVELFAYPFGGREQINAASRQLVRDAGFLCCASCHGGTNGNSTDPYHLNRIGIAEWYSGPHQFGAELVMGKAQGVDHVHLD